eukprot:gene8319-6359_t
MRRNATRSPDAPPTGAHRTRLFTAVRAALVDAERWLTAPRRIRARGAGPELAARPARLVVEVQSLLARFLRLRRRMHLWYRLHRAADANHLCSDFIDPAVSLMNFAAFAHAGGPGAPLSADGAVELGLRLGGGDASPA